MLRVDLRPQRASPGRGDGRSPGSGQSGGSVQSAACHTHLKGLLPINTWTRGAGGDACGIGLPDTRPHGTDAQWVLSARSLREQVTLSSGVEQGRRRRGWDGRAAGLLLLRASRREATASGLFVISAEPVGRVGVPPGEHLERRSCCSRGWTQS